MLGMCTTSTFGRLDCRHSATLYATVGSVKAGHAVDDVPHGCVSKRLRAELEGNDDLWDRESATRIKVIEVHRNAATYMVVHLDSCCPLTDAIPTLKVEAVGPRCSCVRLLVDVC